VLYPGIDQLMTMSGPQFQSASFSITADVVINSKADRGVLFANGDEFEGLSLYVQDGKFQVAHNTGTIIRSLQSDKLLTPGHHRLRLDLLYTGPKETVTTAFQTESRKPDTEGGTEAIFIDDEKAGERKIMASEAKYIGFYKDGIDVGRDQNSTVTDRYKAPFNFTGILNKVVIVYK
jgi:arylsulfatase